MHTSGANLTRDDLWRRRICSVRRLARLEQPNVQAQVANESVDKHN